MSSQAPAQSYYMDHCRDRVMVPFYNLVAFILYLTLPLNSTLCTVWFRDKYYSAPFFKSDLAIGTFNPNSPM